MRIVIIQSLLNHFFVWLVLDACGQTTLTVLIRNVLIQSASASVVIAALCSHCCYYTSSASKLLVGLTLAQWAIIYVTSRAYHFGYQK